MKPYCCPVCLSHGRVCGGFYNCVPGGTPMSTNTSEMCKSCQGSGIIYCNDEDLAPSFHFTTSNPPYDLITKTDLVEEVKQIEKILKDILSAIKSQGRSV